ncbi:Transmembrane protein 106B [Oryzias melastigma]|uniref:Transmembrane protein 106B n=1 Tax=Oryzias melastigma TaxID=30732 RepID=A0A834BMQ4_ORYME|nr:Transmembrane protein 106B [Oryzias melastigma]
METPEHSGEPVEDQVLVKEAERKKILVRFPPYGGDGDTCPTCRGTGRIPRGQEEQLVAVIPCNDVRLKPRHTKLYVLLAMALCLFVCCLILFFLFPRSVSLTPLSVQSVMVYFTPDNISMDVTNAIPRIFWLCCSV